MSGLGLIHAGFLAAAVAVAVPVLIHLLMRPQARPMNIGSLRFLRKVMQESARRRKVRRWLLLALRAAAVLLLALLFARPYFSTAGGMGRDRDVIVLVDQSASMAAEHSGRTLFASALESAEKAIAAQPEGTAVHLGWFDDRGVEVAPEPRVDRRRQAGHAGTDYGLAMAWARDVLLLSGRPYRKVVLITDLQEAGLHRTACPDLPPGTDVQILEVGVAPAGNRGVAQVEVAQTSTRAEETVVLTAQVANAGPFPAHEVEVRLALKGPGSKRVEQKQTVSIAAGASQAVRFSVPRELAGLYQGYVEVAAEDSFPLDDRRWVAFEARDPDRILLVDGEPGGSVYGNETYFLETALRLALPGKGPRMTPYEPERIPLERGAALPDLAVYRVVVLSNVAAVSDADARRIEQFVSGGGRLLMFLGTQVRPGAYEPLRKAGVLPAAIEGIAEAGPYRFQTWEKGHPVFRALSDPQRGDLRQVAFRQIGGLKADRDATVLAAAQSGEPLLVEKRVAAGLVLLFASSADRDWSDWPQSRLYVPLVHQIMGYLTGRLPENQRVREEPAGQGPETPPGIVEKQGVVVVRNLDPRESQLRRSTEQGFREAFQLAGTSAEVEPKPVSAGPLPGEERPDEWWTVVIGWLLVVLVAELFVANRTHA